MVKRFMPVMLAVVMLLSVFSSGLGTYKVQAASDSISYDCIEYGDKSKDNWGYLLVPKGVSGPLQAGIVIHGLSGEANAAGHVTNALKKWGNKISPKIIVLPIITQVPGDVNGTATVYKFRNYVYDNTKEKSPIQDVIAQMDNGTFNKLIANKGYGCSIDNNKSYFVTGWSLGGASAALAGIKYKDIFPYVGVLSPAPTMITVFTNGYVGYKFSNAPDRILMMSAAVREDAEEGCYSQMRIAATQLDTSKKFTYFAFDYAEHSAGLFMTELYIFLYAVDHNGTYPSNEEIKAMYPTQVWRGKTYDTCILDFPDESDQSPNHRWMENNKCFACGAVKKTKGITVETITQDMTVAYNQPYQLEVKATGNDLTYEWQFRISSNYSWTVSDHTTDSPVFNMPGATRDVYYRCVVSNGKETAYSRDIKISVKPVINSIASNPADGKVKPGNEYSITVNASGLELNYAWESSKDNQNWTAISGANTATYKTVANNDSNTIYYHCKVTSCSQTVTSSSVPVSIEGKSQNTDLPVIQSVTTSVKNNTVKMGEYYSMTVNATGSDLSYQWMWRTDKSDWDKSKCPGSNDATIQLEGKRPVVYYKCVVSNAAGSVETAEIPVYLAKPVLTSSVGNTVKKGQKYTISSDVKYDKRFIYKWEYDKDDNKGWRESQLDGCTQKDTLDLEGKNPVITYKLTIIYKDGNNTFSVTSDGVKITMAE